MNHDSLMLEQTSACPAVMVPWYLIASHAYYHLDRPVLSDAAFDALGRRLLGAWHGIEHRHKHLIGEDALRAGTLLLDETEYPSMAKDAARRLAKMLIPPAAMSPLERLCRRTLGLPSTETN